MNLKTVTICLFLFFTNIFNSLAQFNQITVENSSTPEIKIVQIDFRGLSTLVHFEFSNNNNNVSICSSENVYIQDKSSYKKYNLLNNINLPFCPNVHILDEPDQKHFFTLEFEKVPENIGGFDIIEINDSGEKGWSFENCKIAPESDHGDFIDVASFTERTPVKEYGYYFDDGQQIYYYKYNGAIISALVSVERNYGKYYQANILIQNLSGRDRTFKPSLIYAKLTQNGEVFKRNALSHDEYIKKVNNRQSWAALAVAFSEGMAASNAGYSNTYSSYSSSGHSNTYGSASGYVGGNYGSIYGSSNTYSSTYGTSYSRAYDGAAAYAAQQNANRNVANYTGQQYQIKNQISQGYAKIHTINNETEYLGYVNIKYTKADEMKLVIPFNNTDYTFSYLFNSNSKVTKVGETHINKPNPKKTVDQIVEMTSPGIYYNGNHCLIDKEISVTDVKIKCLNETGRAYDKYTINKSKLIFHEITHEWQITSELSNKDNNNSKDDSKGLYYNGEFCKIIEEMPDGYVKIKYLNETGRAYYKKVVLRSEIEEVK
jgi:hypothetical protein